MKKRWISLLVENDIGVLAYICGLFSGKSYNLNSLSVGMTEDNSISRVTISLTSDDRTFEQVKKQLNRSVEVIKVVDLTDVSIHLKELMFVKISHCTNQDIDELFHLAQVYHVTIIDYKPDTVIVESVQSEQQNDAFLKLLIHLFVNRIEVIRGGSVGIEALCV